MGLRDDILQLSGELDALASSEKNTIEVAKISAALKTIIDRNEYYRTHRLEKYKIRLELWREQSLEMSRAVISFGLSAIRTLILINGAAVIALLTFLGSIVAENPDLASRFSRALLYFASGVFFAACVAAASYLVQYLYALPRRSATKFGIALHVLALILATASLAMFCYGAWISYSALSNST